MVHIVKHHFNNEGVLGEAETSVLNHNNARIFPLKVFVFIRVVFGQKGPMGSDYAMETLYPVSHVRTSHHQSADLQAIFLISAHTPTTGATLTLMDYANQ